MLKDYFVVRSQENLKQILLQIKEISKTTIWVLQKLSWQCNVWYIYFWRWSWKNFNSQHAVFGHTVNRYSYNSKQPACRLTLLNRMQCVGFAHWFCHIIADIDLHTKVETPRNTYPEIHVQKRRDPIWKSTARSDSNLQKIAREHRRWQQHDAPQINKRP